MDSPELGMISDAERPTLKGNMESLRDDGLSADAGLIYALFWLRGGRAHKSKIFRDADEWAARYGVATWDRVLTWVDDLAMDAAIAEPIVRRIALGKEDDR